MARKIAGLKPEEEIVADGGAAADLFTWNGYRNSPERRRHVSMIIDRYALEKRSVKLMHAATSADY